MTVMRYRKLLKEEHKTHSARMPDALYDAFKDALPANVKIGHALSIFVCKYMESSEVDRLLMLNPQVPMEGTVRKIVREEIEAMLLGQRVKDALEPPEK